LPISIRAAKRSTPALRARAESLLHERRADATALPQVSDNDGQLRLAAILGVANVAGNRQALAGGGVDRHEGLVRDVVDLRQIGQLAIGQVIDWG
jgi:hypothetical protein